MTIDKVRSLEGVFSEFERKYKCCMDKYAFRHIMRQVGGDHVTDREDNVSVGCGGSRSWEGRSFDKKGVNDEDDE